MSNEFNLNMENSVKDDEIYFTNEESREISKVVENRLVFRNLKDSEVASGKKRAYSFVLSAKIKEKFGITVTVGNGLKTTKRKMIVFMKCQHNVPLNVSTPIENLKEGSGFILQVKQKVHCNNCPKSK